VDDAAAIERLRAAMAEPDEALDLAAAALLLAELGHPQLDPRRSRQALDDLAAGLRERLGPATPPEAGAAVLGQYLGHDRGFTGNVEDYYDPANSYLNEVLERRTGLPITLSVVYMEVGRRAGLAVQGIAFPGHFIVGVADATGVRYLDPFRRGTELTRADLAEYLRQTYGAARPVRPAMLRPASKHAIIVRMLRNLKHAYLRRGTLELALRATDRLRALHPESLEERRDRAVLLFHLGRWREARKDLTAYLTAQPRGPDAPLLRGLLDTVETVLMTVN
jgi:regulator of sirC expression with transglutaminase-like and TPR domain